MDEIMALCKRRGFVYPASEIYGGINGFWDYGPLGAQLKKNLRDAWWEDVVLIPCQGEKGPAGAEVRIVPLDSTIIQNPRVWVASGHVGGFSDPMVDCRETKQRFRADHLHVLRAKDPAVQQMFVFVEGDETMRGEARKRLQRYVKRDLADADLETVPLSAVPVAEYPRLVNPNAKQPGTLTEPRQFNLMFKTYVGATASEDDVAYLRPETAQGIFTNFRNVVDTVRVKVPFGIAQTGKAFRNEVTPRNFTFRSREFEQMEIEFFCHPDEAREWYSFWRAQRMAWWQKIGLGGDNLRLREHERDELAHYAKDGAGTSDIEYRFPFTAPGFGELEGIAHRSDFDLRQHQQHSGVKLEYFDQERGEPGPNGQPKGERYLPHVIEPSAGLDRGVLALLCEAFTVDPARPSGVVMRFHPRMAPIKAGVFPLVNKDGLPEVAARLHLELTRRFARLGGSIEYDAKQSIGKRYARMDEAGCPFCFTVDGDTLKDQTVTVRYRDTGAQERVGIDQVPGFLAERLA
ncbi:MAG: glycine--tRNA ligase [Planctomycetes bacterium]|nr:glycine--tRNA ligase [Planctomycetota bacterium]